MKCDKRTQIDVLSLFRRFSANKVGTITGQVEKFSFLITLKMCSSFESKTETKREDHRFEWSDAMCQRRTKSRPRLKAQVCSSKDQLECLVALCRAW